MILAQIYKYGAHIRLPIYNDGDLITKGQGLKWGQDAGTGEGSYTALIDCAAAPIDVFAVAVEGLTETSSNHTTPIVYSCDVQLVDPVTIWKGYYDDTATSGAIDAEGGSDTAQITHGTGDDNLAGSWVYICRGTGIGQLRYVKGSSTTIKTANTAFTTAADATSDFLLMRNVGMPTAGQDTTAAFNMLRSAVSASGPVTILKNYTEGPLGVRELHITDGVGLETDGLNGRGIRFFSLIIFEDTHFAAASVSH